MLPPLRTRLRGSPSPSFGTWISSSSLVCLDALQGLGFDWFVIDTEHAAVNPETVAAMVALQARSTAAPLVRVGDADPYLVKQALDAGAQGILVPLVHDATQARAVVSFAKYPPQGVRGIASAAASRYGRELPAYLERANSGTLVGVQIETREALDHLEEIAAVEGVDLLFVGPQDLTLNLGLGVDRKHPTVREAMRRVVEVGQQSGKLTGTLVVDAEEKRTALELGFRFISLASDVRFLLNGATALLGA